MIHISILTVILALLIFSLLIFVHELGHFIAARRAGVTVDEFSIGMGPKLLSKTSKESGTKYSLRLLPIGGYVSMPGENGTSDDPNALCNKSVFARFCVVISGALMNFILGIIIMTIVVACTQTLYSTRVLGFNDDAQSEATNLMIGDTILELNGEPVHIANELVYEIMRHGSAPVDLKVKRADEILELNDVRFPTTAKDGRLYGWPDFKLEPEEKNVFSVAKHACFRSVSTVKMIWESLVDLVTGRYGIEAVSGPIGVTEVISETAQTKGVLSLLYLVVVITMNLGIFNLLPLPALDGGRLLFLIVEALFRRQIDPELEAKIHALGIIALMLLMAFVTYKDITKIFIG